MKHLIKTVAMSATIAILGACSSVSIIPQEKILARSDGLTETPKWASYGVGSYSEKGSVIFVGNHEASTGSSLSMACFIFMIGPGHCMPQASTFIEVLS